MKLHRVVVSLVLAASVLPAIGGYEEGRRAYDAGDCTKARRILKSAAKQGEVEAQVLLAELYAEGKGGERDRFEARRWMGRAAARRPELDGRVNRLEEMLEPAEVERVARLANRAHAENDYVVAAYEWLRAANRGDRQARVRLAECYATSYGVVQDRGTAYVWARLAAEQGHGGAARLAGSLSDLLTPEDRQWAEYRVANWEPHAWDPRPVGDAEYFSADEEGIADPVRDEASYVRPDYPEQARVVRAGGRVVLDALILSNGRVSHPRVLSCTRPRVGFEEAALDAVQHWRYRPAIKDGRPVPVTFTIRVNWEVR